MKVRKIYIYIITSILFINLIGCSTENEEDITIEYRENNVKSGQAVKINQFEIEQGENFYYSIVGYNNNDIYAIKYEKVPYQFKNNSNDDFDNRFELKLCKDSDYIYVIKSSGAIKKTYMKIGEKFANPFSYRLNGKIFSNFNESYFDVRTGSVNKIDVKYLSDCGEYYSVMGNADYFEYEQYHTNGTLTYILVNCISGDYYKMTTKSNPEFFTANFFYDKKSKAFFMITRNKLYNISLKNDHSFEMNYYGSINMDEDGIDNDSTNIPICAINGNIWLCKLPYQEKTKLIQYNVQKKCVIQEVNDLKFILNDEFDSNITAVRENYLISALDDKNAIPDKLKCVDEEGIHDIYDFAEFVNSHRNFTINKTNFIITNDNRAIVSLYGSENDKDYIKFIILDLSK
ncbi:MAG: hypothetical protein PUE01_09950 [Clostridiaceae bacterium]|nr:hypothetical protein [Clostridiaceae bacterium]